MGFKPIAIVVYNVKFALGIEADTGHVAKARAV
jgi:hypothetical protein